VRFSVWDATEIAASSSQGPDETSGVREDPLEGAHHGGSAEGARLGGSKCCQGGLLSEFSKTCLSMSFRVRRILRLGDSVCSMPFIPGQAISKDSLAMQVTDRPRAVANQIPSQHSLPSLTVRLARDSPSPNKRGPQRRRVPDPVEINVPGIDGWPNSVSGILRN
jgi:hypothetical protein